MAAPKHLGEAEQSSGSDLVREAGVGTRREILDALAAGPLRYTELSRRLRASQGELSRHLARLVDHGLVTKDAAGGFHLTPLGEAARRLVTPLAALGAHAEFFRDHNIDAVPDPLLGRLHALGEARHVTNPFELVEAMYRVSSLTQESFASCCLAAEQFLNPRTRAAWEQAKRRIREGAIETRILIVASEWSTLSPYHHDMGPRLELATIERLPFMITVSEREAVLTFQGPDQRVDFNQGFVGTGPAFVAWCRDLYDSMWEGADRRSLPLVPSTGRIRARLDPPDPSPPPAGTPPTPGRESRHL